MSFNANFYTIKKAINSTLRPSGGRSFEIILKDGCDVLNPVIQLQLSAAESPAQYNYCFIPLFDRYYYCRWKWENRLWTAYCEVDPMATYKPDIGASTQYVVRSASQYDLNVSDSKYPTKAEITHHDMIIEGIQNSITTTSGSYVVGIKSKDSNTGAAFYVLNEIAFRGLVYYMFSDMWQDSGDIDLALQKMLVNPFEYIISVNWFPFEISGAMTDSVYFGYWDSQVDGHLLSQSERMKSIGGTVTIPDHPQKARGNYLNASPYTSLYLDLYTFGRIPLDPNMLLDNNRTVAVTIGVDLFTGIGNLRVASADGTMLHTSANVSIPVQLSQVRNDLLTPVINTFGAAWNYAKGNMIGTAASIANTIESAMPHISSMGAVGSIAAYANNLPKIEAFYYNIVDEDLATIGRPLCKMKQISALHGYVQCENVDIATTATPQEKRTIIEMMESGFFYE